jgi:hypothetical protein
MLKYSAILPPQSFTFLAPLSADRRRYQGDRYDSQPLDETSRGVERPAEGNLYVVAEIFTPLQVRMFDVCT